MSPHRPPPRLADRLRLLTALLLAVLVLSTAPLAGCGDPDAPGSATTSADPDQSVAALVALAQSYHVQADVAVERDDLVAAEQAMRELVATLRVQREHHPESLELGLDAYTRLARILVDQARPQEALAVTDEALAFGGESLGASIFGGYLYQTRGHIQRSLGDDAGTVESHRQAILIFKGLLDAQRPDDGGAPKDPSSP